MVLANSPVPTAGFAHKQMVVAFSSGAAVGEQTGCNLALFMVRLKVQRSSEKREGRQYSEAKNANALVAKESKRNFGDL